MLKEIFRNRFIDYMTNGMPVHIEDSEVFIFYEELDRFINEAPNDFQSYYLKGEDNLTVCDKFTEYLNVSYEESKLVFKLPPGTAGVTFMEGDHKQLVGEAFLGILLFVEKHAPSDDIKVISEGYLDKWYWQ